MSKRLEELVHHAADNIQESLSQTCPTCGRGAASLAVPTTEDLEALIEIRDGFNTLRRNFSPEVEEQFRRFDRTISYLNRMIAGSV